MLPKQFRITAQDFYHNPRHVRRFISPMFDLRWKDSTCEFPRFCILVKKSVEKKSTGRHRSRRLVIEILRYLLPKITGKKDITLSLRHPVTRENREEVQKHVEEICVKNNLIYR